jgi:hypothetical protein
MTVENNNSSLFDEFVCQLGSVHSRFKMAPRVPKKAQSTDNELKCDVFFVRRAP